MDVATSFAPSTELASRKRARKVRTVAWWFVIVLGIGAIAVAAWWFTTRPTNVIGSRVSRGNVAEIVYATGFVEPQRPVDVSSRVTAPVTAVLADEGEKVVQRQALATLDAEDQRQTIGQLSAARIKAEQDEGRALALFSQGWMAKAGRDEAVATANAARAAEASARAKLDQFTIRSGISGVVLRREIEPGDLATASKILFEIGDPKLLRVTATVDERDIPLVRTGSAAMMSTEAFPGRVLRGYVYEITPGGDPDQRAFRVRIRPEQGLTLPVGLTLEVNIMAAERQNALLVPPNAVRENAVWAVEDGRAVQKPVQVGIRGASHTEIRRGLSGRDCVVSDPSDKLKNGQRVSVKGC
jgi:RND family efflux transporter MFP subunit